MIRETKLISQVYLYEIDSNEQMPPYDAICTIIWETPSTIWVRGLKGGMSRKLLIEFYEWLTKNEISMVKAHRELGRVLPRAKKVEDHLEILVADLLPRYLRAKVKADH